MDFYTFIISIIKDLGFPAATLIMMWKLCLDSNERQDKQNTLWKESIDANTNAINELTNCVRGISK